VSSTASSAGNSASRTAPLESRPIPPARVAKVEAARKQWIDKLIDPSRRNNLLFFRDLKVGTLDLSSAPADAMQSLLRSGVNGEEGVPLSQLVRPLELTTATASVRELAKRALSNFEERGLDTLFLALGLASWPIADGGRPPSAPVLLVPMRATLKGNRGSNWSLRRTGDVRINDVLLHALSSQFGLSFDSDALLTAVLGDDEGEAFDLAPVFDLIRARASGIEGFAIEPRWVLGNFSFQKMAIVRDLKELLDPLARHDIIAGIAGDSEARERARAGRATLDPREFDQQLPDQEFLVLDADSSQQLAVAATLKGQNGVISGPPGTGKSQTIANLIAELTANGKTVLFVAEKRAALDVVLERLRRARLDHLALDLHGADISRRTTAQRLADSLELVRESARPDVAKLHADFVDRRERLNRHARQIHAARVPSGLSVLQLYGRLLRLPEDAVAETRLRGAALHKVTSDVVDRGADLLKEAAAMPGLLTLEDPSPWTGAVFSREQVATALDVAGRLASERWPTCERALSEVFAEAGIAPPRNVGDLRRALDVLCAVNKMVERYRPEFFESDLEELAAVLVPAGGTFTRLLATVGSAPYRHAVNRLRELCANPGLTGPQALADVSRAREQQRAWATFAQPGTRPNAVHSAAVARELLSDVLGDVQELLTVFPGRRADDLPLASIGELLAGLARDNVTPARVLRMQEIVSALEANGLKELVAELRKRKPPPASWDTLLHRAWLESCLDDVHLQEPTVASFSGRYHDGLVADFVDLDRRRLEVAVARVRRAHAERVVEVRDRHRDQSDLVAREAQKKARHLPLRKLFAQAPDVLLALRPCWMASPLSVSQLLPGDLPYFDVVIFDEASQVLPEDAVTSLLRGKRAVIAGDAHQLPPTTFFAAGTDDDSEEDATEGTLGFESVLDVMSAFLDPPWSLNWHYRSRDEALIAFSNHQIYGGRLVTFPGPGRDGVVSWVHVPHVAGEGGSVESAGREVARVVELILEHARTRPDESLGVIAMGIKHAERVEMALDLARRDHPELDDFFAVDRSERFFVKNLERVQGDEREAIILTVGYGKDETGRLLYRFGPLLQKGGERRLNVAITRARRRLTLVSSFSHADVRPDYPAEGVRLLRAYIEFAAAGGRRLDVGTVTSVPLNDFEQSVADALARRDLNVVPQLGTSCYRIDLVLTHPNRPGQYVLAVECDGASYHSAPTARDRDRLRQQHLEALGWRFHRIWSTDWFLRREEEIERLMKAFQEAVRHADAGGPLPQPRDVVSPRSTADDAPRHSAEARPGGGSHAPVASSSVPGVETGAKPRGPRPSVQVGQPIDRYSPRELQEMVRWISSDGRLRTRDETVAEMLKELGFARRGSRIAAALEQAIDEVKRRGG
jgi:very-short-patch-repair endonuclease